uniref:Putative ATP-dependent endonuclease of the OLD family n=1 Tax=Candidatus Kentrum sp. TUN TaxID=2126343 RepID=A0A450ZM86_9GAMM|nr:MAG: putative ATP-dependent endonuclease of the OLD family [Candidatus Kentron sp. TUN]VFK60194.1 MAG: putative ATP-dependent endonuclease of the OLD family [Candidatus Kentron sp. TUN]
MKLRKLKILNFRGIRNLEINLNDTTVLIGENNSGKTTILDALRLCLRDLGPRRRAVFEPFDFHLKDADAEPATAKPIEITITFSEDTADEWEDRLAGQLNRYKMLQIDDEGRNHVVLQVTCNYDAASREFEQNWNFLNLAGQPLFSVPETALNVLQYEVSYYYLTALRDAFRHFDAKGPFWRPFLKDSQLSEEKKAEIEQKLREVNNLVVASHTSFNQVRERLNKVQDIVSMASDDMVSIEAVPGRMFDMLAKAQIYFGASTSAKVPIHRHGEGTQSLAVLMLFSAFLDAWPQGVPIIALEEPEAHLHPSAVRTLWGVLDGITGQKLISTHSGDLLSEIDIHNVRRLTRTPAGIQPFDIQSGTLSTEETRKFNYHIRRARGELLFARCWLLVEGETESWIFPAAARAMDIDIHKSGVRIVEFGQSDIGLFVKVANALGISWHCVLDNDSGRKKYEAAVKNNLGFATEDERLSIPYPNTEIHFLSNGYDAMYEPYMSEQNRKKVTKLPSDPNYWAEYASHLPSRAKTRGAAAVAIEMENRGAAGVTKELVDVLEKVVALAGGG